MLPPLAVNLLCFVVTDAVCVEELVGIEVVNIAPFLHLMASSALDEGCCITV